jgi:hypothetical protein
LRFRAKRNTLPRSDSSAKGPNRKYRQFNKASNVTHVIIINAHLKQPTRSVGFLGIIMSSKQRLFQRKIMAYTNVKIPTGGEKITIRNGELQVPNNPIIPFVEGDGTGRDIWRASVRVFDAAVAKAYGGERKVHWMEVYAG